MKIDLHCHTKATKKGDGTGRNVTPALFREKIVNADVKIVAITNHNHFDIEQYKALRNEVKDVCQVWPGVEIDIQGLTKWHLIVVANPINELIFNAQVAGLFIGKDINKCALQIEEVYAALNGCDVIYIPHYHKEPGIKEEDREKLTELVGDESRVFLELSNHRSLGIYTNYGYRSIVGSDVKDWTRYDSCQFAELKLPVESFSQFCLLAKRDKTIVDTLLNKKESLTLTAHPHKSVRLNLRLFRDINIVFGPKGTGKTEIVKSLYDEMVSRGIPCEKYIASERVDEFKAILSTADMKRDLSLLGAEPCVEEFKFIKEWKESNPTPFDKYKTWHETKGNSINKQRMKITEATDIAVEKGDKYNQHKADKKNVSEAASIIEKIDLIEYLDSDEAKQLSILIKKLKDLVIVKRKNDLVEEYSALLTNYSLKAIKDAADKCTDTVSRPSTLGLAEFANNRLELYNAINSILSNIKKEKYHSKIKIGELEGKGDIYVTYQYRFLCQESERKEFDSNIGIRRLQHIIEKMQEIKGNPFAENVASLLGELNSMLDEVSIESIQPFLGISKYLSDGNGNPYSASNGEQGIILLQRALRKDADAFFLDEPELGMGNSYIDATIRPLIVDLSKKGKYIVIATHNANIAVRTLPYMSIYRTHENGIYNTYVGNPFNDLLINLQDEKDVRSWAEESMHSLEGGKEAFYERKDIYESKNN